MQGLGFRVQKAAAALTLVAGFGVGAQEIQMDSRRVSAGKGHVTYAAEVVEVAAGKPTVVELRFQVDPGFHVNSHTPKSELLIPTELKLEDGAVKVTAAEYPKGMAFRLGGETLDVYQGEFRVRVKMMAGKGANTLRGGLKYQACDSSACYPPRTLAVVVAVNGK